MEDDRQSNKRTWVARMGRSFGFILSGWLLLAATAYFFIFPIFFERKISLDFRIIGLFSLLPLGVGILGMVKKPTDRELATRIATWIVIMLAVFSIFVDGYLYYLAIH
jgi:1,4-dihydroxy-2-naphthoate octaprenyltransferase